jgi:hypothetical protein
MGRVEEMGFCLIRSACAGPWFGLCDVDCGGVEWIQHNIFSGEVTLFLAELSPVLDQIINIRRLIVASL